MPYTYRDYGIREVAISVGDANDLPSGHERKKAGDIIAIRKPLGYIGKKERTDILWLRIEGFDLNDILYSEPFTPIEPGPTPSPSYDKRRYCIPLHRLPGWVDLDRVRDTADAYQPFLPIDEDTGEHMPNRRSVLRVEGLIFNKATGRYI